MAGSSPQSGGKTGATSPPAQAKEPGSPTPLILELSADPDAGRVDRFIASAGLGLTRSRVHRLIEEGRITVGEKPVRASLQLKGGERIRIESPAPEPARVIAEDLPVDLVYEDQWLAVVAKPRGLVVHPGPGHPTGTLVNALLHRCRDLSGVGGVLRPGIVHRLDKDTSGLIVVAKDDGTHRALQAQFQGRSVRKTYLAVVLGRLAGQGTVDQPVGRHPVDRKKMAVNMERGRSAVTHWRVLQALRGATLVEVRIETGRTHQIRVHMASLGHPVAGDPVYGGASGARGVGDAGARKRLAAETSQALHAWRLSFRHPHSAEEMSFEAPVPEEMARLIQDLDGNAPGRTAVGGGSGSGG